MTETKVCLRCDVEKPFFDFHKDISRVDKEKKEILYACSR